MRQKAAAGFEVIEFIQVSVGQDGGELQSLVERGVRAVGFGIVGNKIHSGTITYLRTSTMPNFQLVDINRDVTVVVPHYEHRFRRIVVMDKSEKRNVATLYCHVKLF